MWQKRCNTASKLKGAEFMRKKVLYSGILALGLSASYLAAGAWGVQDLRPEAAFSQSAKKITVNDDGLEMPLSVQAATVGEALKEVGVKLESNDRIIPAEETPLHGGAKIWLMRAKKLKIKADGKEIETLTYTRTVEQALWEKKEVALGEDDLVKPERTELLNGTATISVIRVQVQEEIGKEDIPFKTVTKEDDKVSWREKKITQKGEKGVREVKSKVVYHDGKEVSRKILSKQVTKEPVEEIVVQGTYVKVGKAHRGQASWYAHTGTMAAANPWLPMGSYVKVTNLDNGKSVIVKINDRGPFGPGRIIDLDKVAFQKIASLGQGVANVKMEEIAN